MESPASKSTSWPPMRFIEARRLSEYSWVSFPIRIMKRGISGIVTAMKAALIQSSHSTTSQVIGVTVMESSSWGRKKTK